MSDAADWTASPRCDKVGSILTARLRPTDLLDPRSDMIAFRLPILAAPAVPPPWPDRVDSALTLTYLAVILGVPLLGYVVMYLDFRRWLRSLRRAMVFVAHSVQSNMPYWAISERPGCLAALDLRLPCTEEQVMAAYRERVKELHPDRGGDLQKFLRLQKQFEQALHLVRCQGSPTASDSN